MDNVFEKVMAVVPENSVVIVIPGEGLGGGATTFTGASFAQLVGTLAQAQQALRETTNIVRERIIRMHGPAAAKVFDAALAECDAHAAANTDFVSACLD